MRLATVEWLLANLETLERNRWAQRKLFRKYLHELSREFNQLHAQGRMMIADAGEESAPIVLALMRQKIVFWFAFMIIEVRLMMAAQVCVRPLAESIDALSALFNQSIADYQWKQLKSGVTQ